MILIPVLKTAIVAVVRICIPDSHPTHIHPSCKSCCSTIKYISFPLPTNSHHITVAILLSYHEMLIPILQSYSHHMTVSVILLYTSPPHT